ncbi:von Willebrand factor type A domain-containing protein [Streptomyces sp. MMS21 TC-5]|uniref:vWA domain-containing protein n=1 Tax=Streptomyces TaxID=1883 RepID=UPI001F611B02|nr:von Willebrand factor type A domain-containing protein [Streptomyces sp. MMS21 TC-5]MCI4079166.1 von Willebrand factor type A domain-containing protein [Streptomyces sp. MMS21 TC-5]
MTSRTPIRDRDRDRDRGRHHNRRAARPAVLAVLAAAAVLLSGCSASDGGHDRSSGTAQEGGRGSRGGNPAPAPAQGAPGTADRADGKAQGEDDGRRTEAPPADYLSTFALDVDTASWGYARRTLADGNLPDPRTVRPEEFVNSFRQDYRQPDGNGFSVTVDGARTDAADWSLMRVGLATRAGLGHDRRPPAALTFVVDISGSMAEPGRLDLVRKSLDLMTDRLRGDDSVAVVAFSGEAQTRLPMTRLDGNRKRVHEVVDRLRPTDSTNVEAGVTRGYDIAVEGRRAGATNRVVLLSDALANTGTTSADALLERIDGARRDHGITLFGVGVGSDYNDAFMERLVDKGDGHTVYVSDEEEARRVFCDELPAQVELRARDAKAQVSFDPRNVERFRLIGYDNRRVADDSFRDDSVDGGEVGPGHTVTALYAVRLRPGASGHVATATVRWLDPDGRSPHEESGRVEASALTGAGWEQAAPRFQVTVAAAYLASSLRERGGGWEAVPGAVGLGRLSEITARLAERTEDPEVRQLSEAVRDARRLLS